MIPGNNELVFPKDSLSQSHTLSLSERASFCGGIFIYYLRFGNGAFFVVTTVVLAFYKQPLFRGPYIILSFTHKGTQSTSSIVLAFLM